MLMLSNVEQTKIIKWIKKLEWAKAVTRAAMDHDWQLIHNKEKNVEAKTNNMYVKEQH